MWSSIWKWELYPARQTRPNSFGAIQLAGIKGQAQVPGGVSDPAGQFEIANRA